MIEKILSLHKISQINILLDIYVLTTPKFESYDFYRKKLNSLLNEKDIFIQIDVKKYILLRVNDFS